MRRTARKVTLPLNCYFLTSGVVPCLQNVGSIVMKQLLKSMSRELTESAKSAGEVDSGSTLHRNKVFTSISTIEQKILQHVAPTCCRNYSTTAPVWAEGNSILEPCTPITT